VVCHMKRGDEVAAATTLAEIHGSDEESAAAAAAEVLAAYEIGEQQPAPSHVILEVLA
jgi:thymidine phosphorylase